MKKRQVFRSVAGVIGVGLLSFAAPAYAGGEGKVADVVVKALKAGRAVVSENQSLINDESKGDKGFTSDSFAKQWAEKYKETYKSDMPKSDVVEALLSSGKEVVDQAQTLINKQGMGFKGFLPALWGRKTGEKFGQKTGITLKQTAQLYRFAGNKPDEFEADALKQFSAASYPKGKELVATVSMGGKQVLRYVTPEYAAKSCLTCHGGPKGEKDITGMKKEGYQEGDVAGAISVVIPVK